MTAITAGVMLFIYPGMVKWIPKMAMNLGWIGPIIFFIAILWGSWWAISNKKSVYALIFSSILSSPLVIPQIPLNQAGFNPIFFGRRSFYGGRILPRGQQILHLLSHSMFP